MILIKRTAGEVIASLDTKIQAMDAAMAHSTEPQAFTKMVNDSYKMQKAKLEKLDKTAEVFTDE